MFSTVVTNTAGSILLGIAIDIAIFNIIYSTINSGVKYIKNVIIYVICLEIRLIIMTGIASFGMFLISLGLYLVVGLVLIWILYKISNYFPRASFIATSIILQSAISWLIGLIL